MSDKSRAVDYTVYMAKAARRLDELRERRMKAAALFANGMKQAEVARRLDVSRESVSRWYRDWKEGGVEALNGAQRIGRRRQPDRQQLSPAERELLREAEARGISPTHWRLSHVVKVIDDFLRNPS